MGVFLFSNQGEVFTSSCSWTRRYKVKALIWTRTDSCLRLWTWSFIKNTCSCEVLSSASTAASLVQVLGAGLFNPSCSSLTVGHSGKRDSVWMWLTTRPDFSVNIGHDVPLYIFVFVRWVNDGREGCFFSSSAVMSRWSMTSRRKQPFKDKSLFLDIKHQEQDHRCTSLYISPLWAAEPCSSRPVLILKVFIDCVTLCFLVHFCKEAAQTESMCCCSDASWLQLCLCNDDQLQTWNE